MGGGGARDENCCHEVCVINVRTRIRPLSISGDRVARKWFVNVVFAKLDLQPINFEIDYINFTNKPQHIIKYREKYQDTPGCLSIYQNAPESSKFTNLPLCPKKCTL